MIPIDPPDPDVRLSVLQQAARTATLPASDLSDDR